MCLCKKKGEKEGEGREEGDNAAFGATLGQCICSLWTSVSILKENARDEADDCKILSTSAFKGSLNYGKLKEFRKDIKNTWTLL